MSDFRLAAYTTMCLASNQSLSFEKAPDFTYSDSQLSGSLAIECLADKSSIEYGF